LEKFAVPKLLGFCVSSPHLHNGLNFSLQRRETHRVVWGVYWYAHTKIAAKKLSNRFYPSKILQISIL